ncbi:hypothetical protein [Flavobacterium sp.]|uniref:hypothetical protein n=1 Tax=Flavobacterium sp. TaxID=239 RepID=UPI003D15203F
MITRNRLLILITVGGLLLVPLVAMQFTKEVNWSLSDFILMGILLSLLGWIGIYISRKTKNKTKRILLLAGALLLFLLLWAELTVGIFNTPLAGS